MAKEYWDKPRARTKAKLDLLRNYLGAWFEILANATDENGQHRFGELAYLDGFCGRGEYEDGQDGSPLIAVRFANSVAARRGDLKIKIILVDKLKDNVSHLKTLQPIKKAHPNVEIYPIHGSFEDTVLGIFDRIKVSPYAPSFSFVDPYGIIRNPESTFAKLVRNESSELFINFMEGYVNRFIQHQRDNIREAFVSAIGPERAERVLDSVDRINAISREYTDILRSYGRYVRNFQMRDESNVRDNAFFFCGNSRLGFKKIKEAMWKIDPVNGDEFSAYVFQQREIQDDLLKDQPYLHDLKSEVLVRYSGQRDVTGKELKSWANFESERFLYTHLRYVLEELVFEGIVTYRAPSSSARKRRTNTWSDEGRFDFATVKPSSI